MHEFLTAHTYTIAVPFPPIVLVVAAIWTLIWKGFALWYAASGRQKTWFVVLLLVNTLGVLEIIYLIWCRPRHVEHTQPADSSAAA